MTCSRAGTLLRAMVWMVSISLVGLGCLPAPDCLETATCPSEMSADGAARTSPEAGVDATMADVAVDVSAEGGCGSPTDRKNCGVCGHDCTALPNVNPQASEVACVSGSCVVPASACAAGFGHCSSRPDDGCETNLTDSQNCGSCGTKCADPTPLCSKTQSGPKCSGMCLAPTADLCVSSCVDLQSDPKNCGSCGHDCAALPNVAPGAAGIECRLGVCYVPASACLTGFAHCSARPNEGCESSLLDAQSCGTCATQCSGATPVCSMTVSGPRCGSSCSGAAADTCGTSCVNLQSDPKNCGSCGHDCTSLPNVRAGATGIACRSGVCSVPPGACASGFTHCSSRPDDGCETDITRPDNCGQCGKACTAPTGLCSTTGGIATCISSCVAPSPDLCGSKCIDVKSDPTNCGVCGHDCTALPEVRPGATGIECRAGACFVPPSACVSGYAHCSSRADDGCETDLTRPTSCGQCGRQCAAPTALCSTTTGAPVCSSSCAAPSPDLCATKCVDLSSDVTSCGACGHDCTRLANVRTGATGIQCRAGVCSVPASACVSGFAHCSAQPDDGCEANLTDPRTCGSCTNACPATAPACSTSTTPYTCVPNCSGSTPNLCGSRCVNTRTDPANCGACGFDCSTLPHVRAGSAPPAVQCASGACMLQPSACASGFGHCTANPNDGCETNLNQPATCGSCTNACTSPLGLCASPNGVPTCSSNCMTPTPTLCGSTCVNTQTDPKNCGTCGHDCTALPHLKAGATSVQCSAGNCVVPQTACATGFANCTPPANDTDGCETPTTTNTNCGGCGVACNLPNAIASCSTGSCVVTACNTGFGDCTSAAGCETNVTTTSHCNSCTNQCPAPPANAHAVCIPNVGCSSTCNSLSCPNGIGCIDELNDAANCGSCGHACPLGCTAGQCRCAVPDMNIVPNAGFDHDLSSWTINPNTTLTWIGDDAFGCATSGSIRITTTNTTTAIEGASTTYTQSFSAGTYTLGAHVRRLPGSAAGVFTMDAYLDGGSTGFAQIPFTNVTTDWQIVTAQTAVSAPVTSSVQILLAVLKQDSAAMAFQIEVDSIFLAPAPSLGWR